jgi:tetratricopeptide (TPR) repeat protein
MAIPMSLHDLALTFRPARVAGGFTIVCLSLACTVSPDRETLAGLRNREPDLEEARIDHGIDQAMDGYRKFLEEAPKSSLTPEAMRRLADLKLEKEYGSLGPKPSRAATAPESQAATASGLSRPESASAHSPSTSERPKEVELVESDSDFEQRTLGTDRLAYEDEGGDTDRPGAAAASAGGPLEAIALYDEILESYPNYPHNDRVLYQKARAFDELGRVDDAIEVAALLVDRYPDSRHLDEIQFRRGEYFFTRKKFIDAEGAYSAIVSHGVSSDYYELALYKLGWTFYKQMLLEEALASYIRLLDHKVAAGIDFDHIEDEADEQRIADTYRVTSLCFSDLGGAEAITSFFNIQGRRSYEDRVYRQLGEFYLEKLRYHDAATAYETFVDLYPVHRVAPHFSMRVVEIYEAGDFPRLVLEAKKSFAVDYGLRSAYWEHVDVNEAGDVRDYLKQNIRDLANHYHALYQATTEVEERPAHLDESAHWYREYLASFPNDAETAGIHYQFADLLLENESFGAAATEYERIAYDYPQHEQSAAAGYAAVFAHRKHYEGAPESHQAPIRREVIASSLRFVDAFPDHEHASPVLAAATDDLYELKDYPAAIANGHRLIESYPASSPEILRGAWTAIAHASFDSSAFKPAEQAYTRVLELTPADDDSTQEITENLAASIYKQAEESSAKEDHRAAADHFLRIAEVAPNSEIRPLAEYDAAAALVSLEDWGGASEVLEAFRSTHPDHELNHEATRQVAYVYREAGDVSRAASEYERVAAEAQDLDLRRESLLVAGELYEEAGELPNALNAYGTFVTNFTHPIEPAVVTRFKMAEIHSKMGNEPARRSEFERIVEIYANAGDERTPAVRTLAGRSALRLSEDIYESFADIELTQPFDASLRHKRQTMQSALSTFEGLIDYGVSQVTAAATFYMAEIYGEFSRALLESERPTDLSAAALLDYEDVLEEEAFPFEEKTIAIHEKNLELMSTGVFNEWVEKSLDRLAIMMPGRYAKHEISTGPLESIDSYAYRKPFLPTASPGLANQPELAAPSESEVADLGASEVEDPPEPTITEPTEVGVADPSEPAAVATNEPALAAPSEPELAETSEPATAAPTESGMAEPSVDQEIVDSQALAAAEEPEPSEEASPEDEPMPAAMAAPALSEEDDMTSLVEMDGDSDEVPDLE